MVVAVAAAPTRSSERRVMVIGQLIGSPSTGSLLPTHERAGVDTIAPMRPLETLTAADFAPLRGDRFRIAPDDATPFDAELIEITEIPREPGGRTPFSIVFRGGPDPPLPQRIYRVQHEGLGLMEIFLVPIASDRYEAVFA
jgi:hypothetical protein